MCQQALEPYISHEIMTLHHDKHHQAYVNKLNAATASYIYALQNFDIQAQIALQQEMSVDHPYFPTPGSLVGLSDISVANSMAAVISTIPSSGRTSPPHHRRPRKQILRRS